MNFDLNSKNLSRTNEKNNEHFKLESRLNEISGQLEDITEEMESLEGQYSSVNKELSLEREAIREKEETILI